MKTQTIHGVRFEIDDDGFTFSAEGSLGHISECEALARLFQSLFEITDQIKLNPVEI